MKLPSYERQNQWLRDYVFPILCDLDFKKVVANYRKNNRTAPVAPVKPVLDALPVYPGNCPNKDAFIKYILGVTDKCSKLPVENKEALIERISREWLPKGISQGTFEYHVAYTAGIKMLLEAYADTVPREKRLPKLQSIIESQRIGSEYRGDYQIRRAI